MANLNKLVYGTPAAVTITLGGLASSATWVAGRESTAVDNTSNLHLDYILDGIITVGTTPTANTEIRVYVVPILGSGAYGDVFDGTDSAETATNTGMLSAYAKLAATILVPAATSDLPYPFSCGSVASLFGGLCPRKFSIFVTHNAVAALHATDGNHVIYTTGVHGNNNA